MAALELPSSLAGKDSCASLRGKCEGQLKEIGLGETRLCGIPAIMQDLP